MITKEQAWELMEDLNSQAYDVTYGMWVSAGEDEDLREKAGLAQQSEFLHYIEEIPDDDWEAFQHYYKNDEDFKLQYQGYAGRPMWGVE